MSEALAARRDAEDEAFRAPAILRKVREFIREHAGHATFTDQHQHGPVIGCNTCATALGPRDFR